MLIEAIQCTLCVVHCCIATLVFGLRQFFSKLILVGSVDRMIHLYFPNMDHDSSCMGAIACTDLVLYRMSVCVAYLNVISYHDMSAIY